MAEITVTRMVVCLELRPDGLISSGTVAAAATLLFVLVLSNKVPVWFDGMRSADVFCCAISDGVGRGRVSIFIGWAMGVSSVP